MATGNSTLVVNDLLMYMTSYIRRDIIQDIQNVVHDTYDDGSVTLANNLLWEQYSDAANPGKTPQEGQSTGMLKIHVDGIRKNGD